MAALAGVTADDLREPGYLAQALENKTADHAAARLTMKRVVAEGAKLVDLAKGAGEGMRGGIC